MSSIKDSSKAWSDLAAYYENSRAKEDSLDRLVEWPAQREVLGDVTGRAILDLGCGNGAKLAQLVEDGAIASVGVDISGNFIEHQMSELSLIHGDLCKISTMPQISGCTFDRIMFLQSFGYAEDPIQILKTARSMLTEDGYILLSRTQPFRYALERAEKNGTSLGEEYFSGGQFTYTSKWNDKISLIKRSYTISDLMNIFSTAGLWIESAQEPQLSDEDRRKYPHKQEWLNKYLGILIFKLRPLPPSSRLSAT